MLNQAPMDMHVLKMRQPLYVTLSSGEIQNSYEVKVNNKTNREVRLRLEAKGLDGATVDFGRFEEVTIKPEKNIRIMARLKMKPAPGMPKQQNVTFWAIPLGHDDLSPVEFGAQFFLP
jgi:polyferredoxin